MYYTIAVIIITTYHFIFVAPLGKLLTCR